jgi:hypothetical protein
MQMQYVLVVQELQLFILINFGLYMAKPVIYSCEKKQVTKQWMNEANRGKRAKEINM